jgi:kynurenine formamidase
MDQVREIGERVSNWGRWGDDDQRGALNLIGPEQVRRAAGLVRKGKVISLGVPFDADGPLPEASGSKMDRRNPSHVMTELGHSPRGRGEFRYTDDWIVMPLQASTQWDALSHVILDGEIYNGFNAAEHITGLGAARCGIESQATGVVGRGVLLDVARHRGVPNLELGEVITPQELTATAQSQQVELAAGDIVLIRTGWWEKYRREGSREDFWAGEPGPGLESADWFRHHDVAAVAADNFSVEAVASLPDGWASPEIPDQAFTLHVIFTKYLGMLVGEIFDLTELASDCAEDGVYDFFFSAPPLPVTGAVGSPINPLVVK